MKEIEKTIIIILFILTLGQVAFAQPIVRSCGSKIWVDEAIESDPSLEEYYNKSFRSFNNQLSERSLPPDECPLIIPVHVIIVHPTGQVIGEGDNLTLEHIQSQIDVINEDFRRLNADAVNTPPEFSAEDTGIQFCLASVDPMGFPTDGVTRYGTDALYDFGIVGEVYDTRINIKNDTGWDKEKYLNIWVAPTIGTDSDIIGFSRVPSMTNHPDPDDDGISILTSVFGGPGYGTLEPYDLGRTTTHELGHYFGLFHIASKNNTCSGSDGMADTPTQFKQNHGCPTHPNISCGNDGDMFMNYMDYTDDSCMNAFTADQGEYMRTLIKSLRSGLLSNAAIACPGEVSIELEITDIGGTSCYNGDNGFVSLDACGGNNENYLYQIDGGAFSTDASFTGLTSGFHTITVRNDIGVIKDTVVNIFSPSQIEIEIQKREDISCFGSNDGSFKIGISGGTVQDSTAYEISINNGPFTSTTSYSTLPPGTYNITVRDENGCEASSTLALNSPASLSMSNESTIDVKCFGESTGQVTIKGNGGTPEYSFSKDGIIYDSASTFSNLSAGSVEIWIKDNNNCVTSAAFFINEPDSLQVIPLETQSISCAGNGDGEININVIGGTGPYFYYLNSVGQASSRFTNLFSGTYDILVEDAFGCEQFDQIIISDPPTLFIDSIITTDVLCAGDETGVIEVVVSGGSSPYLYFIDGKPDDDGIFTNLSENLYEISIQDAHQCAFVSETVIITNGNLRISQAAKSVPTCSYSEDGLLEVTAGGGAGLYTYSIDGINFQESNIFEGLASDIYIVRVSDGQECLASTVIDLRAPEPVALESLETTGPTCYGTEDGIIDFEISGGSGNYDYKLNGNIIEDDLVTNLISGDYILEVVDAKGCRFEMLIPLEGNENINIELNSISPADCSVDVLGSLSVTAQGGSGGFVYELNDEFKTEGLFSELAGGVYTLVVTDMSGCSSSMAIEIPTIGGLDISLDSIIHEQCPGSGDGSFSIAASGGEGPYIFTMDGIDYNQGSFNNLEPGVYDVFVSDNASCGENFQIEIFPGQSIELDSVDGTPPSCHNTQDGTLRIKGSQGNGTLQYILGNRENQTGIFPGVGAGDYTITITDNNMCETTFDIVFAGPEKLSVEDIEIISPTCNGISNGSIYLKAGGGTGNKSIIYNGNTFLSEIQLEDIIAKNYRFDFQDENGCSERIDVFVDDPSPIEILDTIIVPQNIDTKGTIELVIKGGSKPYSYSIDGGPDQAENTFSDLIEGIYEITVTDSKGCTFLTTIMVPYDDTFENPEGSISDVLLGFERIRNETILSFIAHGNQKIKLYIFDAGGRFIMSTEEFSIAGPNRMTIPARNFPPGIYIVRIDAERESEYHKFIKL